MLNADTKLYIVSCTKSKKPKLVNITSSPQTNGHNWFFDTYNIVNSGIYLIVYDTIVREYIKAVKLDKLLNQGKFV